ncbi:MAG: hypothetical protein K8H89_13225 [Flavobacteriales bacterium]|nr:hypothetical protein [Flavobacteriales bacterium]
MFTAPFTLADLDELAELEPADWDAMMARLRWHLSTPYATVIKSVFGEALTSGLATGIAHEGSGWVGDRLLMPRFQGPELEGQLVDAVLKELKEYDCATVSALVEEASVPVFLERGFEHDGAYLRYAGGKSEPPTLDEVELCEPHHSMGILHLDRTASGEQRRVLISEHFYASRIYVEKGRVRGNYMPLLGDGLLLADRPDVGEELLRWHMPHVQEVWVPEANPVAREFLAIRGYTEQGRRFRMHQGPALPWRPEMVYGWISERLG